MGKVVLDMSLALDGIGAGPTPSEEDRMGAGGERFHAWFPFYDPDQDPTAGVPAAGAERVRAAYSPASFACLASVKRRYDPTASIA